MMLFAAAIWGFAFSAQKAASHIPPFTLNTARSLLAAVFLFLLIFILDKLLKNGRRLISKRGLDFNRTELVGGAICGVILSLASLLQQSGIGSGTDAGKAAFITALYVVLVPVFSLVFGKRAPMNAWISVGIAVVGFYLLCIKGDLSLEFSDTLVLLCALVFTLHILAIDKFSPKCDGVRMSCIQFAVATVLNLLCALIFEPPIDPAAIGSAAWSILMLGIGSSGIAYTLQIVGQRGVNPAVASVILSLESVFGVIGSAFLLGEKMTEREYAGCAIVFIAVILSQLDFNSLKNTKR